MEEVLLQIISGIFIAQKLRADKSPDEHCMNRPYRFIWVGMRILTFLWLSPSI